MTQEEPKRIVWHHASEAPVPATPTEPGHDAVGAVAFPPPWPDRPWIYANVIASANGIVAWTRRDRDDDPLQVIAGGDFTRPGRRADAWLLHSLRASADVLAVGAQTLRDQPDLMAVPAALGGEFEAASAGSGPGPERAQGPRLLVYSESGRLDLDGPVFNDPQLTVIVVTAEAGAERLRAARRHKRAPTILVAGAESIEPAGLVRAHQRLRSELGVRYLDCEGGMVALAALRRATILDEIFVTVTDVHVEPAQHQGIKRVFDFENEGARLVAEGRTAADPGYVFRRWRFNAR